MFKLCTKFDRNRTIRGGVIDDLARRRRPIFRGAISSGLVLTGAWTELYQIWRHRTIKDSQQVCYGFPVCWSLSKTGLSPEPKFYPPAPAKIRRGMGEII